MKTLIILISILFLLPQQGGRYQLAVTVTGLKPLKGDLYVSLHQRPEYFQFADSALMKTKIKVNAEMETVIFNKVPAGQYAIAVYHDENLNGKMDANEIGIPKEGYGFSNNPKMQGKPKFEQAVFDLGRNDTIVVKMIYRPVPGTKKDTIK